MTTSSGRSPDWYCVKTRKYWCDECEGFFFFVHSQHCIVVWPEKDDPSMLRVAERVLEKGGNAKVVRYQQYFGEPVSFYA